jgi:hypothetical protein
MHALVQDATGINFTTFGSDVAAARAAAISALPPSYRNSLSYCPSVGHVLNEVGFVQILVTRENEELDL